MRPSWYTEDPFSLVNLPNHRIDLHTINEMAPLSMNMAANFEYRFDKQILDNDNTEE